MLRRRTIQVVTLAAVLSILAAGCEETVKGSNDDFEPLPEWTDERPESEQELEPQPFDEYEEKYGREYELFVDADQVQQLRDELDATVIDVRNEADYQDGHLPGAVHSGHRAATDDQEGFKPLKDPDYHATIPRDVGQIQQTAREMGVYNDRPVVLYGAPGSKKVGRLFWAIEFLGHGGVHIYTPGKETLLEELGVDPSTESVDEEGDFVVRRRSSVMATTEEVRQIAEGDRDGILIDTRREEEFTGENPRGNPQGGYIPEANWYHWEEVFTEQDDARTLRSRDELQSELDEAGLFDEELPLIPYCETGTRSSFTYAALRWLGAEQPKNYDGSWRRWSRATDAPVNHDGAERLEE